ncbi:MAG: CvpA family protein [Rikenellaceae bacterium]
MNVIDIIFIIIALIALYRGYKNGLVVELCGILGIIIGIYIANRFSTSLATHIDIDQSIAVIIAFIALFCVSLLAVYLIAKVASGLLRFSGLGAINGMLGALASLLKTALIMSVIYTAFLALNQNFGWVSQKNINSSKASPIVESVADTFLSNIDFVTDYYKKIEKSVSKEFDKINL